MEYIILTLAMMHEQGLFTRVYSLHTEFGISEPLCEFIHFIADRLVDDPCVDLRRTDFRVTEHLANGFDRDTVRISDGCSERMPGKVRGDVLLDFASRGDLLEV